jgi:hypothetical protein
MSKPTVVARCGPPQALDWRPPDYRDQSLWYFFDYLDIDVPGCPGASYAYGDALVLFTWDGAVASVLPRPTTARVSFLDADGLTGCGASGVATELFNALGASQARAVLETYATQLEWREHETALEALRLLPATPSTR